MIPRIGEAIPFSELLQARECLICPYEEAEGYGLYRGLLDRAGRGRYGIVVGPEGGMTREEAHSLREAGGGIVTLGPRILRTETAGMAVLSAMLCVYNETITCGGGKFYTGFTEMPERVPPIGVAGLR